MQCSRSCLAVAWVACATCFTSAAAQDHSPISHRYDAPVVVVYDPDVLPLTDPLLTMAVGLEQLARRASEVAGAPVDGAYLTFQTVDADEQAGRIAGNLALGLAMKDPASAVPEREVWLALVEELEDALRSAAERLTAGRDVHRQLMRDLFRRQRQETAAKLEEALAEVPMPVQIMDVAGELQQLFSKRREVSLQLAGIEARRQALQDRMEELKNASPAAEIDREIIQQLDQVVALQQKQVDLLKELYKDGRASLKNLSEAEAEFAKSRVDLLRAKKEAAANSSPELTALSAELGQATIAAAEQRAILQAVESRIEELKQMAAEQTHQMQAAQQAEHRAAILREQLAAIEKRLSAMELERLERMAARGGTVTIVPWSESPSDE